MGTLQVSRRGGQRLLVAGFLLLLSLPVAAEDTPAAPRPILGPLLRPGSARVVVHRETCRCAPLPGDMPDVLLLTVGTESERDGGTHFHPLATLAFDRTLGDDGTGQWVALWVFGPSPAGWRRTLRALLPLPVGAPNASAAKLARLEERIGKIQRARQRAPLQVPAPVLDLTELGRASRSQGIWGALRRGLSWANVVNPAQFIFRTYLVRRKDRQERNFQRTYVALQWLLDLEFREEKSERWLATLNELRFHLLRNRSFYGRWVPHAAWLELIYDYESDIRRKLGKSSSWLQSAANEHHLRYQPIYRYRENGAPFPMGGVLYYDPRLGAQPDPGWWDVANPFDLPYNPHKHPEVQRLAREHPDELIPLAVYTFNTNLALRPIIVVDFFAPRNPRMRESSQQLMVLVKQWLAITTGPLSVERLPYRLIAWAANKKGFTLLVDKSSRRGVEELRLALEADLYFDPERVEDLLERADQRVLNPLIKAGRVEERLAHLQYESLRARQARAVCRRVNRVRQKMAHRLGVPDHLAPAARRQELAQRLQDWNHQVRLEDFVSQPLDDLGPLRSLEPPLRYFLQRPAPLSDELEELLAELYAELYRQKLRLPPERTVPELEASLALTRQVWQRGAGSVDGLAFEQRVARIEQEARAREQRQRQKEEEQRVQFLRHFLQKSHRHFKRARHAGCEQDAAAPSEVEAHLVMLREVTEVALRDEKLWAEYQRHLPRLRRDLEGLQAALRQCPPDLTDPWRDDSQQLCLALAQAVDQALAAQPQAVTAGGGD